MPTLYDYPRAPSPRRARVLLSEKGIAHETVIVDLAANEHRREPFCSLNPAMTLPVLRLDDGGILPDNAAIAAWAEAVCPQPALLGETPREKAEIASWNSRIEFDALMAVAEAMRNSSPGMKGRALPGPLDLAQIPELAERGRLRLGDFLQRFDAHMRGREFVATARFSVADIAAKVAIDFARVIRVQPDHTMPNIQRWSAAMAARPAFQL